MVVSVRQLVSDESMFIMKPQIKLSGFVYYSVVLFDIIASNIPFGIALALD